MVIFATVSPYILFDAPLTSCLNLADKICTSPLVSNLNL